MDPLLRFLIKRYPEALLFKAIFELCDMLQYPVDSRADLRKQLALTSGNMPDLAAFVDDLPALLFPISSQQNALEKLLDVARSLIDTAGHITEEQQTPAAPRMATSPNFPADCERECTRRHLMAVMGIWDSEVHGQEFVDQSLRAIDKYNRCLSGCQAIVDPHAHVERSNAS